MPTSLHDVRRDAFNYVWDRSIPPALEVRSGDEVLLHARDASDEQLHQGATATDVATLDFAHVNPGSGPVFVAGAAPGDTLEVEILELVPQRWGWTAIIPGFGLLADEYPDPWLRISEVDAEHGVVRFSNEVELALRAFPGTIGVAPAEPGPHSVIPPSRWGGNLDTRHLVAGATLLLPIGVEGALFSLGDTHAAQGDGEVCGTAVECAMDVTVRLSVRTDVNVTAPQLHRGRPGPARSGARRGAQPRRLAGRRARPRPRGGLRGRERRVRPADPRGRRRAELGRRRVPAARHLRVTCAVAARTRVATRRSGERKACGRDLGAVGADEVALVAGG